MAIDIDFSKHNTILVMISEAQDATTDARQAVRDAKLFLNKRDGQWDPYAWQKLEGRFRGTFDMCTPIVDQISGEIEQSDFSLNVSPSGGDSSIDVAKTYDGLIRNIRNVSNADAVFNDASRSNVIGGFDAVEVVQEFIDGDSFDQDLVIKKVPNAVDSVWFDLGAVKQDASDAKWCVKLIAIPAAEYKERFPEGSNQSVGDDKQNVAYFNNADFVTVGQLYYKKQVDIELVRMTNGAVYKVNDDFDSVKDELEQQGVTIEKDSNGEEKRRMRKSWRVHSRLFDGGDWLGSEEKTVFNDLPIIPIYGNFDIFENKVIYFGKIEKLYDQQRILNYAMSRDIEDGALSPSPTKWMTREQAEGNDYSKMNTDHHPIRLYNHVDGQPLMPTEGGPVASSGLQTTIANTQQMISASANSFNAQQGNANPTQSGIAGNQQIEQGNIGSIKWFKSLEVMVCQVGKVLINAIPRVYDSTRQVRILEEDGTSSMVTLHDNVLDFDNLRPDGSPTPVELNDLSKGDYDVICDFGPAFNSQQKETAQAFLDMAAINPEVSQRGMDIWLKNLNIPGMDMMAERFRESLLEQNAIPFKQMTPEEQQKAEEAANQPPQPDPNMVFAQAEAQKAQNESEKNQLDGQIKIAETQTKQQVSQLDSQVKMAEIQLKNRVVDLDTQKFQREKDDKFNVDAAKIQQGERKLDQEEAKIELSAQDQRFNQLMDANEAMAAEIKTNAESFKIMAEAMQTFVGPGIVEAGIKQADIIQESQEDVTPDIDE